MEPKHRSMEEKKYFPNNLMNFSKAFFIFPKPQIHKENKFLPYNNENFSVSEECLSNKIKLKKGKLQGQKSHKIIFLHPPSFPLF